MISGYQHERADNQRGGKHIITYMQNLGYRLNYGNYSYEYEIKYIINFLQSNVFRYAHSCIFPLIYFDRHKHFVENETAY